MTPRSNCRGGGWQAPHSHRNEGDSWLGQRSQRTHHAGPKAELHGATGVAVVRNKIRASPSKVRCIASGQTARDAPDRPRALRDAALDPPSSPRGESQAMTGGQREGPAGGHAPSHCHPLPPNAAQGRLRKSLRTSRLSSRSNALRSVKSDRQPFFQNCAQDL